MFHEHTSKRNVIDDEKFHDECGVMAIYGHPEDEAASSSLFAILNPSQELVIYCAGGECKDSLELARKLRPLGFAGIKLFMGGWPEWEKAGYPVEPRR